MDNPPSPDLYDRVIAKINREHKLLLIKRRLFLYSFSLVASSGALIPLGKNLYQDLLRSDFLEISSLLFTDFKSVVANLPDFTLSALESAPLLSITLAGLFLVGFVYSSAKLIGFFISLNKFNKNLI